MAELLSLDRIWRLVKFKVHRNVSSQTLRGLIPKRYHSQVRWTDFEDGETALFLFRHEDDDVVLSSTVRRALGSVADFSEPYRLAVGGCFTTEAASILATAGFQTYTLRDFAWTDESYKSITKAV